MIYYNRLFPGVIKTLEKKVIEILPDLACCEKEKIISYHPLEKIVETYCPVHGRKTFNKNLDEILQVHITLD
jgi:hypothetical protein